MAPQASANGKAVGLMGRCIIRLAERLSEAKGRQGVYNEWVETADNSSAKLPEATIRQEEEVSSGKATTATQRAAY